MYSRFFGKLWLFVFFTFLAFQMPENNNINEVSLQKKQQEHHLNTLAAKALFFAESFVTAPYITASLDQDSIEKTVLNLHAFDCWTLVEQCIALAQIPKGKMPIAPQLAQNVEQLRYRNATVNGYASRIHYFSEWMIQAEKNTILRDITQLLGGRVYSKKVNFMTAHLAYYPKLQDAYTRKIIQEAEQKIQQYPLYFIPKDKIPQIEQQIVDGDIIAITSSRKDLDVVHEGFACWHEGRVHLVHASSDQQQVVMSDIPLADYLAKNRRQSGIMVGRLVEE